MLRTVSLAVLVGFGAGTAMPSISHADAEDSLFNQLRKKKKGGQSRVVNVDLATVAPGQVAEELTLTGALKPKETVNVTPQTTGRLEKTYFQVGDRVSQGSLIAELEDGELQQRVRRAEAVIAVSAASVRASFVLPRPGTP